jgi:hypothetical protein
MNKFKLAIVCGVIALISGCTQIDIDALRENAYNDGYAAGFEENEGSGYRDGYESGYDQGYFEGINDGGEYWQETTEDTFYDGLKRLMDRSIIDSGSLEKWKAEFCAFLDQSTMGYHEKSELKDKINAFTEYEAYDFIRFNIRFMEWQRSNLW